MFTLGLSDVSSWLDSGYVVWTGKYIGNVSFAGVPSVAYALICPLVEMLILIIQAMSGLISPLCNYCLLISLRTNKWSMGRL